MNPRGSSSDIAFPPDGFTMPIIVSCPNCSGQLRVADELIGRKVRCPACTTTFDAKGDPPPSQTDKADAWKFLDLELKDDPAPRASLPPLELEEEIPTAPRDPSPRLDEPLRRARLNDEHDDMFACKVCGRMCHRDARRCSHCGERFDEDDEAPRRRRSRRDERRDTEPHRAGFVLAMGVISLASLALCGAVSPIFGPIGWVCGQTDLRKMREGTMDPEGESSTHAGWICGIIGTCLGVLLWLSCGAWIGFMSFQVAKTNQMIRQQQMAPPPPIPMPKK